MWIRSLLALVCLSAPVLAQQSPLRRIAFGSCCKLDKPQGVWATVASKSPELVLLTGDAMYGDSDDPAVLRSKWAALAAVPEFAAMRAHTKLLATWDDHDYGRNDAGAEYGPRDESQAAFLDFLGVPPGDPRRERAGVYHAEVFGPPGQRVQVILLDTRYDRSPLLRAEVRPAGRGPYAPNTDPAARILSEAQWTWLERTLAEPAEVRVLVSSVQFVAEEHGWEGWGNFPAERARMLGLLREVPGVLVVSGDRHAGEISRLVSRGDGLDPGYPLYDVTASGFNQGRRWTDEPNRHRVGDWYGQPHFGMIEIDWDGADPLLTLAIVSEAGRVELREDLRLSALQPRPQPEELTDERLERIAFTSCNAQASPAPNWGDVRAFEPDLLLMLGDNVYGDTADPEVLARAYAELDAQPGYREVASQARVLATWDDHDYWDNDSGSGHPTAENSRRALLDFTDAPADSPRRTRDGIYGSWLYGPPDQRVQVILLDLRWNKTPWGKRSDEPVQGAGHPGHYAVIEDPDSTLLGEAQWAWLEERLRVPARLRVIGTSLQLISEGAHWECWAMMPRERQRMFDTIRRAQAGGVLFISGDTHWGELSAVPPYASGVPYTLLDMTSSGINRAWDYTNIKNPWRVGNALWVANWGAIEIDWIAPDPEVVVRATSHDPGGTGRSPRIVKRLRLSELAWDPR